MKWHLTMSMFEKHTAYGNGHFFKRVCKNTPNTNPNTQRRGRRGVHGWVFGVFFQTISKTYPFPWAGFSKLHIGRFFKVSGFAKGRRMPSVQYCQYLGRCPMAQRSAAVAWINQVQGPHLNIRYTTFYDSLRLIKISHVNIWVQAANCKFGEINIPNPL